MSRLRLQKSGKPTDITLGRIMVYSLMVWAIIATAMAFTETASLEPANVTPGQTSPSGGGKWITINGSNPFLVYDYLGSQEPTLIYFGQKNCPGCKIIEPVIRQVASETPWLTVVNVRLDDLFFNNMLDTLDMMGQLGIRGTPTLIMVREGKITGFQEGLFKASDQREALLAFIRGEIEGERLGEITTEPGGGEGEQTLAMTLATSVPIALALGLLAAFSPCSLPMLTAYSSMTGRSKRPFSLGTFALLLGFTGFAGLGLFVASTMSRRLIGFDVYTLLLLYMASFVLLWGAYNLMGREPVFRIGARYGVMLPALGLQCSLPFLLTAISIGSRDPYAAVGSALAFSLGFVTPYAGFAGVISKLMEKAKARGSYALLLRIQGGAMLVLATYLYYEAYSLGIF